MTYRNKPQYIGPIQGVIFDIAGTILDHGSVAPIIAFQQLFESIDIPITEAEARAPMGSEKREHIRQLLAMDRIATKWVSIYQAKPCEKDIDQLYNAFIDHQIAAIHNTSTPISGLTKTLHFLKRAGCKIGCNTGYASIMADAVKPHFDSIGFSPDSFVCATQVPRGRPFPDMCLQNA
ncbi:MAG: HAD hydrolase-like protein, partial [Cellvibrionales bacterium]|nr:HAD hydrolase-like protein [Cellvibrionales bacterium]